MDDNDDVHTYIKHHQKKKKRQKKLKTEWLELSELTEWLYAVQNDCSKTRCKTCQVNSSHF